MQTYGIKGTDEYEITFNDSMDLLETLDERESVTNRIVSKTSSLKILTIEEMNELGFHLTPAVPAAINESRLFMSVEGILYPISINSFISIKGRIDLQGKGLFDLSNATLKTVVEELLQKHDKVMVVIIDDKVHAVFSANAGGYKPIPSPELIGTALDALESRIDEFEFNYGHLSYDSLEVKITFPNKKEVLQDLYNKEENAIPGVVIRTSETGFNSNTIAPFWNIDGKIVVFDDEAIKMVHRGKDANIQTITEEIPFIFSKMRKTIALVKKQMAVKINYPDATLSEVIDRMKIGKKDEKVIMGKLSMLQLTNVGKEFNAYDLIKLFMEYTSELTEAKKASFESITGKVFNLNFERIESDL